MKNLDLVELLVDKQQYAEQGVYKGDCGTIVSDYSINGKWQVVFSKLSIENRLEDTYLSINEEDLIVRTELPSSQQFDKKALNIWISEWIDKHTKKS